MQVNSGYGFLTSAIPNLIVASGVDSERTSECAAQHPLLVFLCVSHLQFF